MNLLQKLLPLLPLNWSLRSNVLALGLWAVAAFGVSSLPGPTLPRVDTGLPLDKIAHFGLYAIGGCLLAGLLLRSARLARPPFAVFAVVVLALFGLLDEWYQTYTPGRAGADLFDWLADLAGSIFGVTLTYIIHGIAEGRGRKADR